MSRKYIIISFTGVYLLFFMSGISARTLQDSLYCSILSKGAVEINCNLTYPFGHSAVRCDYGNNAMELLRLDRFFQDALFDERLAVNQVELTGYCSIEGSYAANELLATKRTNAFKDYLSRYYPNMQKYNCRVDAVAEDWDGLRKLIDASDYPWRTQALHIIDEVGIYNGREKKLMDLGRGVPYRQMAANFFAQLRRIKVSIRYDVERTRLLQEAATQRDTVIVYKHDTVVITKEVTAAVGKPVSQLSTPSTPFLIAIKTNLWAWAGMTPKFEHTRCMPNLALEAFFAKRWSALLSGTYNNGKKKWGISSLGVEPRFWIDRSGQYRYLYVGVFGQMGDFDDRRQPKDQYITGKYWQTGISIGYYLPLYKGLGFEIGLRGGYERRNESLYSIENEHYYRNNIRIRTYWGVMGMNTSLSYRF